MELYLIGTVSYDLEGPSRLKTVLYELRPEKIVLACTQNNIDEAAAIDKIVANNKSTDLLNAMRQKFIDSDPETVLEWLNIAGYEYLISRDYAIEQKIELLLTYPDLEELENDFSDQDLYRGLETALSLTVEELADKVSSLYQGKIELEHEDISAKELIDEHVANFIRSIEGRIAYVDLLTHFYGPYHNLYDRLVDLNPKRFSLGELFSGKSEPK